MKRHSTDVVSLVFGLLFVGAAGWWFVARYLDLRLNVPNGGWFIAGALIVLGLLGVVGSLRRDEDVRPVSLGAQPAEEPALVAPATLTTPSYGEAPAPYGDVPVRSETPAPYGEAPAPYGEAPAPYGDAPTPYGATPAPGADETTREQDR